MYVLKVIKKSIVKITTKSGEVIRLKIADSWNTSCRIAFEAEKGIDIKIEKQDEPVLYK